MNPIRNHGEKRLQDSGLAQKNRKEANYGKHLVPLQRGGKTPLSSQREFDRRGFNKRLIGWENMKKKDCERGGKNL